MNIRNEHRTKVWLTFGVTFIAALFAYERFIQERRNAHELDANKKMHAEKWTANELKKLRSGDQNWLYFYDHCDPDELLKSFRGMPEVECVVFELTDLTRRGMEMVAEFPNLKILVLYGGYPGVTDDCFQGVAGHQNLTTLRLINTRVTNDGLRVLKTLPNLRSVSLYHNAIQTAAWNDNTLALLEEVHGLDTIALGGNCYSVEAISRLKAAHPSCTVVTNASFDDAFRHYSTD